MASISSKDTKPEMRMRKALFSMGYRYRIHYRSVIGRPDVAFTKRKIAVFIDGDFWHGNSWKARGFDSLESQFRHWRNSGYWITKVKRNIERDREVNLELRCQGWKVIRVWESEIGEAFDRCIRKVTRRLGRPS